MVQVEKSLSGTDGEFTIIVEFTIVIQSSLRSRHVLRKFWNYFCDALISFYKKGSCKKWSSLFDDFLKWNIYRIFKKQSFAFGQEIHCTVILN